MDKLEFLPEKGSLFGVADDKTSPRESGAEGASRIGRMFGQISSTEVVEVSGTELTYCGFNLAGWATITRKQVFAVLFSNTANTSLAVNHSKTFGGR